MEYEKCKRPISFNDNRDTVYRIELRGVWTNKSSSWWLYTSIDLKDVGQRFSSGIQGVCVQFRFNAPTVPQINCTQTDQQTHTRTDQRAYPGGYNDST